jgi:hypothetical protein
MNERSGDVFPAPISAGSLRGRLLLTMEPARLPVILTSGSARLQRRRPPCSSIRMASLNAMKACSRR